MLLHAPNSSPVSVFKLRYTDLKQTFDCVSVLRCPRINHYKHRPELDLCTWLVSKQARVHNSQNTETLF